jgi:hypothetical protein
MHDKTEYSKIGMKLLVIVCLLAVLTATSCNIIHHAYSGPERPLNEIGILYVKSDYLNVHKIDGETGSGLIPPRYIQPKCRYFYLLPGQHVADVYYSKSWNTWPNTYTTYSKRPWEVKVDVQAGSCFELNIDDHNPESGPYLVPCRWYKKPDPK